MTCFVGAVGLIFVLTAVCGAEQRREVEERRKRQTLLARLIVRRSAAFHPGARSDMSYCSEPHRSVVGSASAHFQRSP